MRTPTLDERLRAAKEMTPACARAADIGADHGRLSAAMLLEGRASFMVTADASAKALSKARRRLTALGLSGRAAFRVSDGLDAVRGDPVDAAILMGMGGPTICGILTRGRDALCGAALVLGPQTLPEDVRRLMPEIGYRLAEERVVRADGRLYVVMRAEPGEETLDERACYLGPRLMEMARRGDGAPPDRLELYRAWLVWRQSVLENALKHQERARVSFPEGSAGKRAVERECSAMAENGAGFPPLGEAPPPPAPLAVVRERLRWVEEALALPAFARQEMLKGDERPSGRTT